jgi:hypothetical protein
MFEKQRSLTLGKAIPKKGTALAIKPKSLEDRVSMLEAMVKNLLEINAGLLMVKSVSEEGDNAYNESLNKDGIPYNLCFVGADKAGFPRILTVKEDGYYAGNVKYNSLSAAAEDVSGIVRKSGWVFWKLPDGRSAKDAFKNR